MKTILITKKYLSKVNMQYCLQVIYMYNIEAVIMTYLSEMTVTDQTYSNDLLNRCYFVLLNKYFIELAHLP